PNKFAVRNQFQQAHPGAGFNDFNGQLERVYGPAFAHGVSSEDSAQDFIQKYAGIWGIVPQDLTAAGPFEDGRHVVPLMYNQATGTYKFTASYYTQQRDGVPVFRSYLTLLTRNEANNPLVLASATLHDIGGFHPQGQRAAPAHADL